MKCHHIGLQSVAFENPPYILQAASAGGILEQQGPLGKNLDIALADEMNHEKSWEKAESQMVLSTIRRVIQKSGLERSQIQYIFAGDLMNQVTASGFAMRELSIPFFRLVWGLFDDGGIHPAGGNDSGRWLCEICSGRSVEPFLCGGKAVSAALGLWRTAPAVCHQDGDWKRSGDCRI